MAELDEIIARGLDAVDAEDFETAEQALDAARGIVGENHVRVLHLQGMLAWARGDLERALGFLMQATDMAPDRPEIYLDCAEALFLAGEDLAEAEAIVKAALALPNIAAKEADEARLSLAQLRLEADDASGSLSLLDSISDALRDHPAYLSTRAAALLAAGRANDAVVAIRRAVELEPDEADFHYQLGVTLQAAGEQGGARDAMVKVAELDALSGLASELEYTDVQELRSQLEDVLEDLPDPLLRLVANAPIKVQTRATREQVVAGVDPRSAVVFVGKPESGDGDAELEAIVIMRDLVVEDAADDEDIPNVLFFGVMEEIRGFFRREDVVFAASEA